MSYLLSTIRTGLMTGGLLLAGQALAVASLPPIDIHQYQVALTPDSSDKAIDGQQRVTFAATRQGVAELRLSAMDKVIHKVTGRGPAFDFRVDGDELVVRFDKPLRPGQPVTLEIAYRATPIRGVQFHGDQLYTQYHTGRWLVSHGWLNDKATLDLELTVADSTITQGNGELVESTLLGNGLRRDHWRLKDPMPAYTFGFAVGQYQGHRWQQQGNDYQVLHDKATPAALNRVFVDVADMTAFFEEKSGVPLPDGRYTYVLTRGRAMQEAAGFSLISESYVDEVLAEPRENWLIAHELAHQWWGNAITCADFGHFWLNEGLVQFLVAAYKEQRFGPEEFQREIALFRGSVKRSLARERYGPVAYRDHLPESEINRSMVYSRGALIFHMLREQLGDKTFWAVIKAYSRQYMGQSVTTDDFKAVLEKESGRNFTDFFERWVYGAENPQATVNHDYREGALSLAVAPGAVPVALDVEIVDARGQRLLQTVTEQQPLSLPMAEPPLSVRVTTAGQLPLAVDHGGRDRDMLFYQLAQGQMLERLDAFNQLVAGQRCRKNADGLQRRLAQVAEKDPSRLLRRMAVDWLKECSRS